MVALVDRESTPLGTTWTGTEARRRMPKMFSGGQPVVRTVARTVRTLFAPGRPVGRLFMYPSADMPVGADFEYTAIGSR